MEIMLLFGIGFVGVIILIMGVVSIVFRRVTEPNKQLRKKVESLEAELNELKSR